MKLAFADAHQHIADPNSMKVSVAQLLDKSYLKGMWERFMETFGEALKEQEAKTGTTAGN
jgi:gamma-glutamyltranspeptidase